MYENPALQRNLEILKRDSYEIIEPDFGILACKDEGKGKLVKENVLLDYLYREVAFDQDYAGKKVLITAGPTQEVIDPVRFISNHSSGKMGYALAKIAMQRGADVTLVSGPTTLPLPAFVRHIPIRSSKDMFNAVKEVFSEQDIVIKAAAVADYTPKTYHENKIKKDKSESVLALELKRTDDILSYLSAHKKPSQFICGFSMETENLVKNSRKKLIKKNLDMIIANNLFVKGSGFQTDTNVVTVITPQDTVPLPIMSKEEVAKAILDTILAQVEP
jgi:phosphopantothenoylcysteine decarboxylase/phosphopantothenate--cysteine ligase